MDPVIDLLRRDVNITLDTEIVYDQRFLLDYYDTTPITITAKQTSNLLYGDKQVYISLLEHRSRYGQASNYTKIRLLANPFEKISSNAFLNRAALKMASIRTIFPNILPHNAIVKISMLAEAPGAMLEYLMWYCYTKDSIAHVTAISLEGGLEWNLQESRLPGVDPNRLQILKGRDGTGDLTNPRNISSFVEETLKDGERDLVVADGGVDVEETPEKQESMNGALILGEAIAAIQLLKVGGSFVLKLYDAYERFTADVLQLLCKHFRQSTIVKPLTSRPKNAERYFVGLDFTGLHVEGRNLRDLYSVLITAAKGKSEIASFLPDPPHIISDFIIRQNDWHSKRQISFLQWSLHIDDVLNSNPNSIPNYPVSYNLSRFYDIVDIPFSRITPRFELTTSSCYEIRLLDKVGQLAREISSEKEELLPYLPMWLRYSSSHGIYTDPLQWDTKLLESWCDTSLPDGQLRDEFREILIRERELEDAPCTALSYKLIMEGDKRIIRAEESTHAIHDTPQVTKLTLQSFLTQRERGNKNPYLLNQIVERLSHLERAFMLLKRYEALRLTDNAYKVTYPQRIDVDLYATLLTRTDGAFYSPVAIVEKPFGALGTPLGDNDPPTGIVMALNLIYASETKLRDELLTRALRLVSEGRKLYVVTTSNISVLDKSLHRHAETIVLAKEKIVSAVTGRILEKKVLLYTLEPTEKKRAIEKEEEKEENEEEEKEEETIAKPSLSKPTKKLLTKTAKMSMSNIKLK